MLGELNMHAIAAGAAYHKDDMERPGENRLHVDEVTNSDFAKALFA
jgi:hypothetical protein